MTLSFRFKLSILNYVWISTIQTVKYPILVWCALKSSNNVRHSEAILQPHQNHKPSLLWCDEQMTVSRK